ncbi:MAG: hypothetical protein WAS73_13715 [Defluviicoccus sp.]
MSGIAADVVGGAIQGVVEGIGGVLDRLFTWIVDGIDGPHGRAIVRFSEREDVEPLWQDVQAGIIRSVSVGYAVRAYEVIENDGEVPVWRAIDWQPLELSAVPIGADQAAGFRGFGNITPCHLIHRAAAAQQPEIKAMDQTTPAADSRTDIATVTSEDTVCREMPETKPRSDEPQAQNSSPADNFGLDAAGTEDTARRVVADERARIAGIYDAARKLGLDHGLADTLVRDGATLDQARGLLIDRAAERDRAIETRPHIRMGGLDERETRHAAVETALLHRFDPHRYALTEPARDWRGYSLIEMARTFLDGEGVRVRGLSRDEIATRALHTTSDFPHILAAVTNKTLRDAYEAAPRTFQPIARRATAADFKEMHRVQLGEAPQLEKVNEAGEFKRGTIGEGKERYRVETWGKVIGITRQVIINDDLDAFTVTGRSGPRGIGGRHLLAVHGDELLKVFDAESREGRGILLAHPVDGDDAVFGFHLDDDFVEEILVLLQHFGDPGEGEDGRDGSHAQAALAALMPRCFQFHGSSSSMRAGS